MKRLTGHALVWGGAAISIAEIETGISMASMAGGDWHSALAAILPGHLLGGFLLFATGIIGARTRQNAMMTTAMPFGPTGAAFFAAANIIQLLGWTAVMVAQGAAAATSLWNGIPYPAYCIAIGALVAVWLLRNSRLASCLGTAAVSLLLVLFAVLSARIALAPHPVTIFLSTDLTGYWPLFELSIAMPLSWLPLISDYTQDADQHLLAPAVSAAAYTLTSCWMYLLGFAIGRSQAGQGIADAIVACKMGGVGLAIVVFSTVTTTFLDAFSAGESARAIQKRLPPSAIALAVCFMGTALAIAGVMERYTDFLYLIASVFAPMAAVQLTDFFICRNANPTAVLPRRRHVLNMAAWAAGFIAYQMAPAAGTLAAMAVSAIVALAADRRRP